MIYKPVSRPNRLPDEAGTPARFGLQVRRAEQSKPTPWRRALVSSEARTLSSSLPMRTLLGIRTQTTRGLNALALPLA